jgi:hypothetical protein
MTVKARQIRSYVAVASLHVTGNLSTVITPGLVFIAILQSTLPTMPDSHYRVNNFGMIKLLQLTLMLPLMSKALVSRLGVPQ